MRQVDDASAGVTAALDWADTLVQTTGARSYAPQIHVEPVGAIMRRTVT